MHVDHSHRSVHRISVGDAHHLLSVFPTVLPATDSCAQDLLPRGIFSSLPTLPARIAVWLVPCTAQLLGLHPNTFHCCGGVAGAVRESIVTSAKMGARPEPVAVPLGSPGDSMCSCYGTLLEPVSRYSARERR
jgi:hypothetical protein